MVTKLIIVIASLLSALAFCTRCKADTGALYVRPTKSSSANLSCPASTPSDCYTLNEWIESDSTPFVDDYNVVLLHTLSLTYEGFQ